MGGSESVDYSTAEQEAVATWPFRQTSLKSDLVECYKNGQVATASCSAVEWSTRSEVNGLSVGHDFKIERELTRRW